MNATKYKTGAFVFWTGDARPLLPADAQALATAAGLDPAIVPEYAGDRTCATRVFARAGSVASRRGWLLRPIVRNGAELAMAIVAEKKDSAQRTVHHSHDATATWTEATPAGIAGDHAIAQYCDGQYRVLRDRLLGADWTLTLTQFVTGACAGTAMRDDGRIYYVPPAGLPALHKLDSFLRQIGLDLIVAEIEPSVTPVVQRVAGASLSDKIAELKAECESWDGTQKPSTYTKRLEEYTDLRKRATLYQAALGIAVEEVNNVLGDLEKRATSLHEIRTTVVRHRDGTTSKRGG